MSTDKTKDAPSRNIVLTLEEPPEGMPGRFEFRRPDRRMLSRTLKAGKNNAFDAQINLVLSCALTPSREELDALFERWPALAMSLSEELFKAVGGGLDFSSAAP